MLDYDQYIPIPGGWQKRRLAPTGDTDPDEENAVLDLDPDNGVDLFTLLSRRHGLRFNQRRKPKE